MLDSITIPAYVASLFVVLFALALFALIFGWAWPAIRQALDARRARRSHDAHEAATAARRLAAKTPVIDVPGYTISGGENGTTPGAYVKAPTPPALVPNSGIGERRPNCKCTVAPIPTFNEPLNPTAHSLRDIRDFDGVPHQLVQIQTPSGSLEDRSFGDRRPSDVVRTPTNRVEIWRPVKRSRGTALGAARTRLDRDIRIGYVMGNPYTNPNGVVYRNGRRLPKPAFVPRLNYNLLGWADASRFDGRYVPATTDQIASLRRTLEQEQAVHAQTAKDRADAARAIAALKRQVDALTETRDSLRGIVASKDRTIGYLRLRIQGLQREASAANVAVTRATEKAKSAEWAVTGLRDALDRAYAARNERHAEHQAEVTAHAEAEKVLLHRISLAHDDLRDLRRRIRKLKGKK